MLHRAAYLIAFMLLGPSFCLAQAPASHSASRPTLDPATEAKLVEIDSRAGKIKDFSARFEQKKFTALLRKPLVSAGTVRSIGPLVRWDTETPEPSVLLLDGTEIRTYYPKQKLIEIFSLDKRMGDLVASPIPRLKTLRQSFAFEPMSAAEIRKDAPEVPDSPEAVAIRLRPTGEFLQKYVREVRVLLDSRSALMLCVVTVDADGDRTVVRVIEPKLDTGLTQANLQLQTPAGVQISRPIP